MSAVAVSEQQGALFARDWLAVSAELFLKRQRTVKPLTNKWRLSSAEQLTSYRARQRGRRRGFVHRSDGGDREQTSVSGSANRSHCQAKQTGESQLQLIYLRC
ncbi:hypothetical protein E3U43_014967 [Larimichthys crocea]|uniref:Uncharacterized protein n=1 Tax=Larimichthys crocea TaxID=215358 RepID=A0ACD3RPA4_LARCR|nr:hypothetical protein E3U43_014967 [Larimichthys crocea]